MATSFIQFRADETAKIKAMGICEKLGIDLQTYLRMCVSRLILENGIPFSVKLDTVPENPGLEAMKKASRIAEENGMTAQCIKDYGGRDRCTVMRKE